MFMFWGRFDASWLVVYPTSAEESGKPMENKSGRLDTAAPSAEMVFLGRGLGWAIRVPHEGIFILRTQRLQVLTVLVVWECDANIAFF
jgi:hypothetical protein